MRLSSGRRPTSWFEKAWPSRRRGAYIVLMPKQLAANLDAARAPGEDMSDVILRLAKEAETPAKPYLLR